MTTKAPSILIVEDEALVATEIEMLLRRLGYRIAGSTRNGDEALDLLVTRQPDLALLDIHIKGTRSGIDLAKHIREKHQIPFVFLTAFSDRSTLNEVGKTLPYGYVVKPFNERDLLSAIELALHKHASEKQDGFPTQQQLNQQLSSPLTQREYEVLEQLDQGLTYQQVSDELNVSINTVKTYQKAIFAKMGASSRLECLRLARKMMLSLLLLLFFGGLQAQSEPRTEDLWERIEQAYQEDSLQLVLELTDRYLVETPKLDSSEIVAAIHYQGLVYRTQGQYVKSIDRHKIVYHFARARGDSLTQAMAADQIGIMNTFMGNMQEGQRYLIEVAEIYAKVGTLKDQADANNGLAIFYNDVGQVEKAIEMYHLALEQYESLDDTMGRANVHANLGLLYLNEGQFDKAEDNILMQGYLDTLLQTQWGLGFHYDFMGSLRRKQGRLQEALYWKMLGLETRKKLPSQYNLAESRSGVANTLIALGRYEGAIDQAQLILDTREQHESLSQQMAAYAHLSDAYRGLGQPEKALDYYIQYKVMSDSIYQRDMLAEVADKDALYRKAVQDEEIARLDANNQLQAIQLRNKNRVIGLTLIGLLLVGGFSWFTLRQRRRIAAQNEVIATSLAEKETLLKEIHHRVKNNLQMVSTLLSLQSNYVDDPSALNALQMGRSRVRSMAIIHQGLYMQDSITPTVDTEDYLSRLSGELMASYTDPKKAVRLKTNFQPIELDIDRLIPLGLIANELITNAMKYAFADRDEGLLQVSCSKTPGGQVEFCVADDGPGSDALYEEETGSFGSLLVRTLTRQLEGNLVVNAKQGTEVRIVFPL